MKTETALKKYLKRRAKAITAILQKPSRAYTVATFHKLRVEIKKLNALFQLVNDCSEDFKRKKTFKPFKSVFRQAGEVRELQLVEAMLKKYNFKSSLKVYLNGLKKLRVKDQRDFFLIISKKFLAKLKKTYLDVIPFLNEPDRKQVNQYMEKKRKIIETLFGQVSLNAEHVHELRKQLKQFYYNRKSLALLKQSKQPSETDELLELLGKWHDKQVIIGHLQKAMDADGVKQKEVTRLKDIKAKLSSDSEMLFTKIYTALPVSEFYNQTQKL